VYVLYVYYIVIACVVLTVATVPATYTLQQVGRSLVTVCLARSNFAPIHLSRRNTPAYGTYHLCVAILTTKHILTDNAMGAENFENISYANPNGTEVKKERQNVADGMRSSSELIFIIRKYKTIYNTKCMG
jgi:hypothetical protein